MIPLPKRPAESAPPRPGTRTPARAGRRLLRNYVQEVAIANTLIAALVVLLRGTPPGATFVYSQAIGLLALSCVMTGRRLFFPEDAPDWHHRRGGIVLIAASCAIGYVGGTLFGDAVFARSSWHGVGEHPGWLLGDLGLTAVFSTLIAGWFYLRGAAAAHRERLAAIEHEATLARLTLLQSQLEPHMLFNTLANLRALIDADPAQAQAMLDRLIDFLRATLAASRRAAHPLADEFARIDDYLALMRVRMGARLRTQLDLPPALAGTPVPPLLLQPLVENAIKHGLEPQRGPGELRVAARVDGDVLVLEVLDSGRGLEAAGAARAQDEAPSGGFGLVQVRERLRTLHGDAASLELAARPEGGTRATARLPLAPPPEDTIA